MQRLRSGLSFSPFMFTFLCELLFFLVENLRVCGRSVHPQPTCLLGTMGTGTFSCESFLGQSHHIRIFFLSTGTIIWDFLNNRVSRFFFQIMDRQRSCTVQEIKLSSEFNQVCEQLAAGAVEEGDRYLLAST